MELKGIATGEGTKKYTERFPNAATGHFRSAQGLTISSIGIGTYLGNWDAETDKNYTDSVEKFVEAGGNVIDTAANYRFQRSERNIGKALQNLSEKRFGREEVLICTKGGFLPFDSEPPTDVRSYFEETFVKPGIAAFEDLVGGSHCMSPGYVQNQLDQSLANMNIEAVDVYYIHNPESQLGAVDKHTFEARLAGAFEVLEKNRNEGKLGFYGVATWNGFRVSPQDTGYHSLEKMVNIARQVGGEDHGFKFIQLPFNLAMPEAYLFSNQAVKGEIYPTLHAAKDLGVSAMISGSIMQGKLSAGLPDNIRQIFGNLESDAQTSLQFVRSTPNVTTALIGMSQAAHVAENMKLANIEPTGEEDFQELFTR
jgi:aryl-alcohol dehydrogenase-like predicted oxidoreductase